MKHFFSWKTSCTCKFYPINLNVSLNLNLHVDLNVIVNVRVQVNVTVNVILKIEVNDAHYVMREGFIPSL